MIELVVYAAARAEFEAAVKWYAARSRTAAERFEASIDAAVSEIRQYPKRHPKWDEQHRFALVQRFPYYIAYRETSQRIEIVAIQHAARDSSIWINR